jgi:hypothetical protein
MAEIREHAERNAIGLISPANSGLIIALALLECADALREQTEMHKRFMEHQASRVKPS